MVLTLTVTVLCGVEQEFNLQGVERENDSAIFVTV
jgi:hypothetical protein